MSKIRKALTLAIAVLVTACGGTTATLHARGKPTGEGPAKLLLLNHADVAVHRIYVARTENVERARTAGAAPGSDRDIELWGEDRLQRGALSEGDTADLGAMRPGRYDLLVMDADDREQLIKALDLKAGGTYVFELADDWRFPQ
jgi:hypothetical protein